MGCSPSGAAAAASLIARDAFAVRLSNARRGLAKPSSHGHYLAMDLEPVRRGEPIVARAGLDGADGYWRGGAGVRSPMGAADCAARRVRSGDFRRAHRSCADARGATSGSSCSKLRGARTSTCSPIASSCANSLATPRTGYIFHPLALDRRPRRDRRDRFGLRGQRRSGRTLRSATSSGWTGCSRCARRWRCETSSSIARARPAISLECVLGGMHGLAVDDLMLKLDPNRLGRRTDAPFHAGRAG